MCTVAEQLAEVVVGLRGDRIPSAARSREVDCLVDLTAAALAGAGTPPARAVRRAIGRLGGGPEATLLATSERLAAPYAAWGNGTAAHSLELDDTHTPTFLHAGAAVIPAALAVGELVDAGGRDLLDAVIVGYETAIRLARAINPSHRLRGFHTTATIGTFGAAAAAGRLLDLDEAALAGTFGIAGSHASGLFAFLDGGENIKRVHPGSAAFHGIVSGYLQQSGIDGPVAVFEGRNGVFQAMADEVADVTADGTLLGIQEVSFKPYPTCRFCHAAMDAALILHQRMGPVRPGARVTLTVSRLCAEQTGNTEPRSVLGRQFSTPYSVALGLLRGRYELARYTDVADETALELAARTVVRIDADLPLDARTATVAIEDGGRSAEETVHVPLGEPANPLTPADVDEKFRDLASRAMPTGAAMGALAALREIETLPSVRYLTKQLTARTPYP